MRRRVLIPLLAAGAALLAAPLAWPQARPLKILLLYDMEGVSGVTDIKQTDFIFKPEYTTGRASLTADVNAAIAGLKAGGATEIVVVDGHGSGNSEAPDVFEDQLLAPAKMISRERPFDIYMDSYDQSIDAIVAIAMHAGAGNRSGFISHTYTVEDVEYRVNGVPFNESMILAMGAARLRIPVIMVSGDDQLEREVRRHLPWVKYAAGKHAVDRSRAESFPREEVSRRIEAAAREAVLSLAEARLPEPGGPYRFALTFQDEGQARNAALVPGTELLPDQLTVQFKPADFEEGYRQSLRLIRLAGAAGQLTAMESVLTAQPNAAALYEAYAGWINDRFLNRRAAAAPASSPAASSPRRYWGAR
jgi:D-amino peptidase